MLISKFSRDGKRGFTIGSNSLTPDKLAAGAITLSAGLVMAAIGGLIKPKKRNNRAGAKQDRKKKPIWLLLLPMIFNHAKNSIKQKSFDDLVNGIIAEYAPEQDQPRENGIEIIDAIPISSEEEVYEHI